MSDNKIKIVLVDDHRLVRAGLRLLLTSQTTMEVVGEATNHSEALEVILREQPNIILLDLVLGCEDGLDLLAELVMIAPGARVLILTATNDAEIYQRAIELGAHGVVRKEQSAAVLLKAIERVHDGEIWLIAQ